MSSKQSGRRRFLKNGAALAGLAVGKMAYASSPAVGPDTPYVVEPKEYNNYGERSHFETIAREPDYATKTFPAKLLTPIQDMTGVITPAPLHFVASHAVPPDIDPRKHRLVIHGMVDRPLSYSMDDLRRLPSVSRQYFLECIANSAPSHGPRKIYDTAEDIHGRISCSEWTGVPLSILLQEAGVQKGATWMVSDGADSCNYSYSLPLTKAMDDVLVAYGQNSEAVRPEQGYPLRLVVPGWQAPFSVKWLRQIKVADEPGMTKTETGLDPYLEPDLKGKARWFEFVMPVKSVILRPSGGQQISGHGFYDITGLAWSGSGAVRRVEVSVNGGKTWKDAELQKPVLSKSLTRFRFGWNWQGEEAVLMSRCTDDQGQIQPSLEQLNKKWGIPNMEYWHSTAMLWHSMSATPAHFNAIQAWKVAQDGSVRNAMFS